MKNYISIKHIKAIPMSLGDYNKLRGWAMHEEENPQTEGMLLEHPNLPSNTPHYMSYISWSPRDVFEAEHVVAGGNSDRNKELPQDHLDTI